MNKSGENMKGGQIKLFTKSGNLVRLLSKVSVALYRKKITCWEVQQIDDGKKMICPISALINPNEVLKSES